ncbi:MAG: TetR/AcrR family transcriptional regulator [Aquificota bacterium]|nr:TetR/AcrR family transcriptional regulator [Aquificota bacterium]
MGQSATKERILKAGKRVIFQKGFYRARVSDITTEAGVAHGTFYLYFKTKEDFLLELMKTVRDEMLRMSDEGIDLIEGGRVEEGKDLVFLKVFDLMVREKELAKILFFETVCTSRVFQEFYRESKELFLQRVSKALSLLGVPGAELKAEIVLGTARHLIEDLILKGREVTGVWREVLRELGVYS